MKTTPPLRPGLDYQRFGTELVERADMASDEAFGAIERYRPPELAIRQSPED